MSYAGIDYSGPGATCNRDTELGIRYGIIPANDLDSWLWEKVESVYTPYCPHCESELPDDWDNEESQAAAIADLTEDEADDLTDPVCPHCSKEIEDGEQWPDCDEPAANVIDDGDTQGFVDDSNDVWCTKSPYYTFAQFCSPCAPGACYLRNHLPEGEGAKAFCFGRDWFEGEKCPYPYWSVETGESIYSPEVADVVS